MQRERHHNDLSYTIPYQLLRDNTRNIDVVHAYTRKRGLEMTVTQRRAKKGEKGHKRKKENKTKERKKERNKNFVHARRAQAESRGDKVAVCWHNQSYDMCR